MRFCWISFFCFTSFLLNAQNFSATSVQYSYGLNFDDIGAGLDMEDKRLNTMILDHYGTWKGGDNYYFVNFFSGNFLDSDRNPSDIGYKIYGEWNPRITLIHFPSKKVDNIPLIAATPAELEVLAQKVYFHYVDTLLNRSAEVLLDDIYVFLSKHPNEKIIIQGHACNTKHSSLSTKALSLRRAESVRRYLIEKGISIDRLEIEGYGDNRPILSNETEYGRIKNRRVEFKRKEKIPSQGPEPQKTVVEKKRKFAIPNIYLTGQVNQGNGFNALMIGLAFRFKLPAFSFFDIHAFAYRKDNFGNESFQITGVWLMPLKLNDRWQFSFQGYFDLTQTNSTGMDFITQPNITLDLSQLLTKNPSTHFRIGAELFYHQNDLGTTSSPQFFARFTW